MRRALVAVVLCLQLIAVLSSSDTCSQGCTCQEEDEDSGLPKTKEEGMSTAVGVLTPLVAAGAGLAMYKVIKSLGSSVTTEATAGGGGGDSSLPSSPRLTGKRGSWDPSSYSKDSPTTPYHGSRRGSTPLSLLGEDDFISFGESSTSPRLDHSVHRRVASRWM